MKKEFFFFNFKVLSPIFLKKAALMALPTKYLIRYSDFKNSPIVLIDTFSSFFLLKLYKKKKSLFFDSLNLEKKIGSFILVQKVTYLSQSKKQFKITVVKQFLFGKKSNYIVSFLTQLKNQNKFIKNISFLEKVGFSYKKKKIRKGFIKSYLHGILIGKPVFIRGRSKEWIKKLEKKIKKKVKKNIFKAPLLVPVDNNLLFFDNQNYLLVTKKFHFSSRLFSKAYLRANIFKRKNFCLRKFRSKKYLHNFFRLSFKLRTKSSKKNYFWIKK